MTTDLTLGLDEPQRLSRGGPRTISYACHGCHQTFTSNASQTSPFCLACRPLTEQVCPHCDYVEARGRFCSRCGWKTTIADARKPVREKSDG